MMAHSVGGASQPMEVREPERDSTEVSPAGPEDHDEHPERDAGPSHDAVLSIAGVSLGAEQDLLVDVEDAVVVLGGNPEIISPQPDMLHARCEDSPLSPETISEDAVVESLPDASLDDGIQVLSEHNYRTVMNTQLVDNVKEEIKEEEEDLSDLEDPVDPIFVPEQVDIIRSSVTITLIKQEPGQEDEDVDVECEDEEVDDDCQRSTTPVSTPSPDPSASSPPTEPAVRPGWRQCQICGASQATTAGYREHMLLKHMRPQPYTCMLCWKSFSTARDLNRHTDSNCKEVFYKCQRCDRVWSSDLHHAECQFCESVVAEGPERSARSAYSLYECAECGLTFPLLRNLTAHVKTHPGASGDSKPFKCHACGQRFANSIRLMLHVRHHSPSKGAAAAKPRAPPPSARKSIINGGASPSPVKVAPRRVSADLLVNPFVVANPADPSPSSSSSSSAELSSDDTDLFQDSVDEEEDWVDSGQETPSEGKEEWGVPEVPANFKETWKRFHCRFCPRVFRFCHQVKVHMRTHTGERPYICKLCGDAFRQSSALKRHLGMKHKLEGPAATSAYRSMIALTVQRLKRERFRALTAVFAKQGGLRGFTSDSTAVATAELLLSRGLGKDLRGKRGVKGSRAETKFREKALRLGCDPDTLDWTKDKISNNGLPYRKSSSAAPASASANKAAPKLKSSPSIAS